MNPKSNRHLMLRGFLLLLLISSMTIAWMSASAKREKTNAANVAALFTGNWDIYGEEYPVADQTGTNSYMYDVWHTVDAYAIPAYWIIDGGYIDYYSPGGHKVSVVWTKAGDPGTISAYGSDSSLLVSMNVQILSSN